MLVTEDPAFTEVLARMVRVGLSRQRAMSEEVANRHIPQVWVTQLEHPPIVHIHRLRRTDLRPTEERDQHTVRCPHLRLAITRGVQQDAIIRHHRMITVPDLRLSRD